MLSHLAEFEVLIEHYDEDPRTCSKLLRSYAREDPKNYLIFTEGAIQKQAPSRAMQLVLSIALSAGLVEYLLRLHFVAPERAISTALKATVCEPMIETKIWEFLQNYTASDEETVFHSGLDILDALSKDELLIARILRFVRDHSNAKIRSKAALFVGRRTENQSWIANRANEEDNARVRASVIESISGKDSDFVRRTFRGRLRDANNRVAGNAALGLYQLKDTGAIPAIYDMAVHREPLFRNTSAWVMGQTKDPRFWDALLNLTGDPDELVQKQARKSLDAIQERLNCFASLPPLQVGIVGVSIQNGEAKLCATVHNHLGQVARGIPPIDFVARTGAARQPVGRFVVDEYDCKVALSVGFVMCLDSKDAAASEAVLRQVVEGCDSLRRPRDRSAVLKLAPQVRVNPEPPAAVNTNYGRSRYTILNVDEAVTPVRVATPVQQTVEAKYTVLPGEIAAMLGHAPLLLNGLPGDKAVKAALDTLLPVTTGYTNPHLIFFGDSSRPYLIDELLSKGTRPAATVHMIAQTPTWRDPKVRRIVEMTNGIYREARDADELRRACFEICSSLQHHYSLRWKDESVTSVELDVYTETTKGMALYQAELAPEDESALPPQ